jgi:uncharacterized protein
MSKFKLKCVDALTNKYAEFYYDNETSELLDSEGKSVVEVQSKDYTPAFVNSKETPNGKSTPKILKISLGLSCNYECSYCNQRFVPNADSTNPNDIQPFIDGLDDWVKEPPERIEFWGGEPLVYWKTLKPLAEKLREKYPETIFSMITNGSLLDEEKNKWLDEMGFSVGLSHDGPGYHVRGADPLNDMNQRKGIMDLWSRLGPQKRMSVNAMLHRDNKSRADIQEFIQSYFGTEVPIGEGSFIDPYDEGGAASSLQSIAEQIEYRNKALYELRDGKAISFQIAQTKISDFINSIKTSRPASAVGQKCGMDKSDNIAVDLNGNVLTCQNVSAIAQSLNGESHKIGDISDFENIKLKTSTHWSLREECPKCPVLQLCKGSCMFLEGPLWETGCNNAFSDNIPFFAASIELLTGYLPFYIEGPQREDRQDIFGLVNGVPEETKKKPFPIPVVAA